VSLCAKPANAKAWDSRSHHQYETALNVAFPEAGIEVSVDQHVVWWAEGPTIREVFAAVEPPFQVVFDRVPTPPGLAAAVTAAWLRLGELHLEDATFDNFNLQDAPNELLELSHYALEDTQQRESRHWKDSDLWRESARRSYVASLAKTLRTAGFALATAAGIDYTDLSCRL
jgi:hypothetical protein